MRRAQPCNRRRGTTVTEGVMALTLFSLAVGMGGMVAGRTQGAFTEVQARVAAGTEVRQKSDRIVEELATIGRETMYPVPTGNFGSSFLYFRQIKDLHGDEAVWGEQSVIFLTYEEGEENDGRDNNGNGLVDECRVVLVRNLDQEDQTVLTLMKGVSEYAIDEKVNGYDDNQNGIVDEQGLSFHLDGSVMTMRLTSIELDSDKAVVRHTSERKFRLMN